MHVKKKTAQTAIKIEAQILRWLHLQDIVVY